MYPHAILWYVGTKKCCMINWHIFCKRQSTCQTAVFELLESGHLYSADTPLYDAYSTPECLRHTAPGPGGEPDIMCARTHTQTHRTVTFLSHTHGNGLK